MSDLLNTLERELETRRECSDCKKFPEVRVNGAYWSVYCDNCYDGSPDSTTRHKIGCGLSRWAAIDDWNERATS